MVSLTIVVTAATMARQVETLPSLFLLTNRGRRQDTWMRDAEPGDFRLYQLEEPTSFGVDAPAGLGAKPSNYSAVGGGPAEAMRAVLAQAQQVGGLRRSLLVFFIHGYNCSVEDSMQMAWLLRRELRGRSTEPVIVSVSWPSDNRMTAYNQDRADAARAAEPFSQVLAVLAEERPPESENMRIVAVAHSMGAFMLAESAKRTVKRYPDRKWPLDEVTLIAPDLARSDLEEEKYGSGLMAICRRSTVYFSKYDIVLIGSGLLRFSTRGRLGSHGASDYDLLPKDMMFVDSSSDVRPSRQGLGAPFHTHSIYWQNQTFLADCLANVSGERLPPGLRQTVKENLFRLVRPKK